LARWLYCDHPGLVEGALEALRVLRVEELPSLIEEAMQRTLIAKDVRQVLVNYQKRLDAIRQEESRSQPR